MDKDKFKFVKVQRILLSVEGSDLGKTISSARVEKCLVFFYSPGFSSLYVSM